MNLSIDSKIELHKSCRRSMDKYDDGEDFPGFSKIVEKDKKIIKRERNH